MIYTSIDALISVKNGKPICFQLASLPLANKTLNLYTIYRGIFIGWLG